MLEDETDFQRADIHIEPPPVDSLTDEDSADEDSEVVINNLPGRVLQEPAHVTVVNPDGRFVFGEKSSGVSKYRIASAISRQKTV